MNRVKMPIIKSAELYGQRFCFSISNRFSGSQGGGKFGNRTGQSLEFVEHREYQPGDDIRHLDWNVAARTDKLTVKLFREEITPHVDVFYDLSESMSAYESKFDALVALSCIFRKAAINSGYSIDNWIIKKIISKIEPSSLPINEWPDFEANSKNDAGETIKSFLPKLKTGTIRILIADLFWNQEPSSILKRFCDGSATTIIIQVVSKFDINPDIYGNVRIIDAESNEAIELICDEELLNTYKSNFEKHRQYWKECCTKSGAIFCFVEAEKLLSDYIPDDLIKKDILTIGY